LPRSHKVYLATDGGIEKEGPGWDDRRSLLVTLLDPFDLAGLFEKRQQLVRFWEEDEGGEAGVPEFEAVAARPKAQSNRSV